MSFIEIRVCLLVRPGAKEFTEITVALDDQFAILTA